jgi:Tfp pilus assembly protein PilN
MYIEINLSPGPKKKKPAGAGISFDALKGFVEQVKDPLLVTAVGAWVVAGALIAFVFVTTTARTATLEGDLAQARTEARRYEALLQQKQAAQALRDSLLAELEAIREIDSDRFVWPHVMDEVTRALPDFTWLTNVAHVAPAGTAPVVQDTLAAEPPLRVLITGRAADIGGYTQFLRQLSTSPWLTNVVAGNATTTLEGAGGQVGRPVYAFTITATFRPADSAFIQTVPVRESVR